MFVIKALKLYSNKHAGNYLSNKSNDIVTYWVKASDTMTFESMEMARDWMNQYDLY